MKHPFLVFGAITALLFSFNAYSSDREHKHRRDTDDRRSLAHNRDSHRLDRRDRQEHSESRRDRNDRDRHQAKRYHNQHRYGNHDRRHDHKHHRRNSTEYFLGGLIVGSLAYPHIYSDSPYNDGAHRISFWLDNYGDCYRIEHRRRGKVYVEVPRYKCY